MMLGNAKTYARLNLLVEFLVEFLVLINFYFLGLGKASTRP